MSGGDGARGAKASKTGGRLQLRKQPRQERSIQRLETILAAATHIIGDKGVAGLKMTELAAVAGIPIGSLYQFFPERAAVIRALHDRHTARVEEGARRRFEGVASLDQAIDQLSWAMDMFYEVFRTDPVYLPVWLSAISDPDLQSLNTAHQVRLTELLCTIFRPLLPAGLVIDLETRVMLWLYLSGATVRRAMIEPEPAARRILEEWKTSVRKSIFTP